MFVFAQRFFFLLISLRLTITLDGSAAMYNTKAVFRQHQCGHKLLQTRIVAASIVYEREASAKGAEANLQAQALYISTGCAFPKRRYPDKSIYPKDPKGPGDCPRKIKSMTCQKTTRFLTSDAHTNQTSQGSQRTLRLPKEN